MRIKNLRKDKHISQEELGKRFDVTKQTVSNWENGISTPNYETLVGLAYLFFVDINFLLDYRAQQAGKFRETEKAFQIPMYDLHKLDLELGSYGTTQFESVPESYVNDGEYVIIKMNDDSMIGERIFQGSKLVVKKQRTFVSGDIVLIRHHEEFHKNFSIRKIKNILDRMILIPGNYEYLQEDYSDKKMSIYGIVKYIGLHEI